jgi:sugar phosphate permease
MDPTVDARRLRRSQQMTVVLLFTGYAAYYFCRADLSVSMPLIVDELARHGVPRAQALVRLGAVYSAGVLAYALGKILLGGLADLWGGRRSFLLGLGGATVFTLLFALGGGLPLLTLAWIGNRLTQSAGWAGLLKVCGRWFDHTRHGAIVGILSVSYLVGDAVARESMGLLLAAGVGWRMLFVAAAAVAALCFVANGLALRDSRESVGLAPASVNPSNVYGDATTPARGLGEIVGPLVRSPAFVLVCLLSFGCTVVREAFNAWMPQFLRDCAGFAPSLAASWSALFPAVGAVSVLLAGFASDRLGSVGRPRLLVLGLGTTTLLLLTFAALPAGAPQPLVLGLIALVAFTLLGPYSYLGGAFALDFGGARGGAFASGIIDGVGYLGGTLAGAGVAAVAVRLGWRGVWGVLAAVACAAALAAAALLAVQRRRLSEKAG